MTTRFYYRDPDAPVAEGPPTIGALALIERDGALLMDRRSDCGRWGLVGGALEANESLELRFIPRADLATLDIVETARPIIDAYLTRPAVVLA